MIRCLFVICYGYCVVVNAQSSVDVMRGRASTAKIDSLVIPAKEAPQFPGGYNAMMDYVAYRIKYPRALRRKNYNMGPITVKFVIQPNGKVRDAQVTSKPTPPEIAEEVSDYVTNIVKVFNRMPRWKPARENGIPVPYQYTLPFQVEINE